MPLVHVFNWIDELRQLGIITFWSTVIPKLLIRGPAVAISWTSCVWSTHQTLDESLIRMLLYCWILGETISVRKKNKRNSKKIDSNRPLISLVCARIGLWSDKCALETASGQTVADRIDLWSDKFQTFVQKKVRSKYSPDHVNRAHREHVCAPRWSDQRSLRSVHLDLGKQQNYQFLFSFDEFFF